MHRKNESEDLHRAGVSERHGGEHADRFPPSHRPCDFAVPAPIHSTRNSHMSETNEMPLAPGQAPPVGAHIVTPRIYVGCGKVVQYRGLARGLRSGPVEEVSLAQFTLGGSLWIRSAQSPCFDSHEVVSRARSRIGEDRYRLLSNNCEHFCEWCLRAEHRSYQVDELLSRPRRALQLTIDFAAKVRSAPRRIARRAETLAAQLGRSQCGSA